MMFPTPLTKRKGKIKLLTELYINGASNESYDIYNQYSKKFLVTI